MGYLENETAIRQNLKDAGCCEKQIHDLINEMKNGNRDIWQKKLSAHRCCLLDELHKEQRCIDCLDYFLYMVEKENE